MPSLLGAWISTFEYRGNTNMQTVTHKMVKRCVSLELHKVNDLCRASRTSSPLSLPPVHGPTAHRRGVWLGGTVSTALALCQFCQHDRGLRVDDGAHEGGLRVFAVENSHKEDRPRRSVGACRGRPQATRESSHACRLL